MPLCARQVEALERHRVCFSPLADEFCGEHGDNTKAGGILYAGGEQMNKAVLMQKVTRGAPSTLVDNSEGPLVQTAVHPCLMTPPGGSRGSARAYWPEITAPAARKLAVALAARPRPPQMRVSRSPPAGDQALQGDQPRPRVRPRRPLHPRVGARGERRRAAAVDHHAAPLRAGPAKRAGLWHLTSARRIGRCIILVH